MFPCSLNDARRVRKARILLYTDERVQAVVGSQHRESAGNIQRTLYKYV